jgi:hypothetical protein
MRFLLFDKYEHIEFSNIHSEGFKSLAMDIGKIVPPNNR